jgi:chorismate synthase
MNSFGRLFRVQIFGESHGPATGMLVDGCPPGTPLEAADLEADLARRRSGSEGTTGRREADIPEIISGLYRGRTTGTPLCIVFRNADTRSSDYDSFIRLPRPGHADLTGRAKYRGFNDPRGSGHFSGRITVGLVAAGAIAKKILGQAKFDTRILAAGGCADVASAIGQAIATGNSVGGLVEIRVMELPKGLGEPFFDTAESLIAHALFAVPGVRGVEFGDGFRAAALRGSDHNDPIVNASGTTSRNGAGGINGGITNGNDLVVRIAVKPASSIAVAQETIDLVTGRPSSISVSGRHDAFIAQRSAVVLEAACAVALADMYLMDKRFCQNSRTNDDLSIPSLPGAESNPSKKETL